MSDRARREAGWLWDAMRAEWFKVTHRRMTYICLAVFAALILLFYLILFMRIREGPGDTPGSFSLWLALRAAMSFRNLVPYSLNLERFFATLVCVIFAGTMAGNEYDWRTVGVVTSRGVRRWHFLFAKVVSGVAFTVVTLLLGFLVATAASAWFTHLYGLSWDGGLTGPRLADSLVGILRTTYVILPFVFLSLLLGTFWRSAGLSVGAALGVFFMEGIFIALLNQARGWISYAPDFFFSVNVDAVMRGNGTFTNGGAPFILGPGGAPEWRGVLVLLAWMSLFVAGVFWRFQTRDIQE